MPLRAVGESGGDVHAFEFDASRWAELKQGYRALGLRIPCCGSPAIPKTSALGNFFFAHTRKGECTTAPESAEHIHCKQLIAQAAQAAGWTVTTERPGVSPAGEEWVADVFCEKGSAQVALEVQMSPQTQEETVRRQLRYKASGVRGAWFFSSCARPGSVVVDKNTPAFVLSPVEVGQVPTIQQFEVSLTDFVGAMLNKRLVWTVSEYSRPVYVEFLPDTCWACKKPVKQVYGHHKNLEDAEGGWHERAFTVAAISTDLLSVHAEISNLELEAVGLNPIGKRDKIQGKATSWPYCNLCLHCRAPQNNFHLGEKLRADLYGLTPLDGSPGLEIWDDDKGRAQFHGLVPIARTAKGSGYWALHPAPD